MNYADWVRREFRELGSAHGLGFVPREEIDQRLVRLRADMEKKELEGLLVIQKMDRYYLSGTTQDGFLYVPLEGEALLAVRKELERAKVESPLDKVVAFSSFREIPSLLQAGCGRVPRLLGLELDVLPVKDYFRFQEIFPGTAMVDSSPLIREIRKTKSPYEIGLMRTAGEISRKIYEEAKKILKEGMTEIEFAGLLDAAAKSQGHEGLLRVRSLNYEAYSWHILSGWTGGIVSQSDSPMGGLGLSPAFPVGASRKVMKAHEPILVDFGICYHGYQVDQTRMFSIGKMEPKFVRASQVCREIHDALLEEVRPGADCEKIFLKSLRLADQLGYRENYLGPPGLQTRFIGHGIGLELNEFPFLAQGQAFTLEEGMTFAIEPKIVFGGEGSAGFENSVAVARQGYEILTPADPDIVEV